MCFNQITIINGYLKKISLKYNLLIEVALRYWLNDEFMFAAFFMTIHVILLSQTS